jgi:hypothetical protein
VIPEYAGWQIPQVYTERQDEAADYASELSHNNRRAFQLRPEVVPSQKPLDFSKLIL